LSKNNYYFIIFTRVGTYVQRGSKFCFVVLVVVLVLVVADTLIRILHYCPISPCFQHIIAYSLARQPCARLPGSLARACPAALRALARQPCARLPGSLARACLAALRALLSRQVRTGSAEFARASVQTSLNRFSRILHHIAPCFYERN
jgi:hypothetical protein